MLNVCRLIKTSEGNKNLGLCTHRCSKRLSNYLNERTLHNHNFHNHNSHLGGHLRSIMLLMPFHLLYHVKSILASKMKMLTAVSCILFISPSFQ